MVRTRRRLRKHHGEAEGDARKDTMKVLHIINNLAPGGAEMLLSLVAPAMKRKGVDVEIATIYKYDNRTLHERLVSQGVTVHHLDFGKRYDIRILSEVRKLTRTNTYDVIHANLFPTFYWVALSKPPCRKLVVTEHNTHNRRLNSRVFKPIERFIYNRYGAIVCVGHNVQTALSSWLPELGPRMQTIYNGIDLNKFKTAQAADRGSIDIPETAPIAAMIARFYDQKDHKTVIEAARLISDLHVLFIGDGERRKTMQEHASRLGVANRIHFLGYRSDVASLLKLSDVYIQSSHYEGIPLSVVEAMACGIPVIASDVGGLREIVQDGISGLLFKRADVGDLSEKLQSILHDARIKAKLKTGALARAPDFSLDAMVDKLIELYAS